MVKIASKAIPDGVKWWLVASTVVLLGSLALFTGNVVAGFVYFTEKTAPMWVTVIGVVSVVGMGLGFGGLLLVFLLVAVKARREDKTRATEQG